jgi:carboxylesterase type B
MASPLSKDLIAGAIGESGSLLGTLSAMPLEEAEKNGVKFAASVGVDSLAALRAETRTRDTGCNSKARHTLAHTHYRRLFLSEITI